MEERRSEEGPREAGGRPHRLEKIETYRQLPIYHLAYDCPVVFDREAHEAEVRVIASLPLERFGLVICFQNLSIAGDYTPDAQAKVYNSPSMEKLRERAVAVVRYNPGSLASLVRTMTAHIYLRQALAAEFAPDLDAALRAVRRGIDQYLESRQVAAP